MIVKNKKRRKVCSVNNEEIKDEKITIFPTPDGGAEGLFKIDGRGYLGACNKGFTIAPVDDVNFNVPSTVQNTFTTAGTVSEVSIPIKFDKYPENKTPHFNVEITPEGEPTIFNTYKITLKDEE